MPSEILGTRLDGSRRTYAALLTCRYREAELAHGRVCMLAVVSSESALVKGKPWMLAVLSTVC